MSNFNTVQQTTIHHVVYNGEAKPGNVVAFVADLTWMSKEAAEYEEVSPKANIVFRNVALKKRKMKKASWNTVEEALAEIYRVIE